LRNHEIKIPLVLFHSNVDFLQSLECTFAIFRTKSLLIYVEINLLSEDILVTENRRTSLVVTLVATEKLIHKMNAEKPKHMFMTSQKNLYIVRQ